MILSCIGSLTGAPAVHPLPYTVQNASKRSYLGVSLEHL
uniref:Uncharacterized protein n=1 Tax=Heterorhabditis bacteriophora TaxID=37862 RepID=A0A1I7XVX4_HETBA